MSTRKNEKVTPIYVESLAGIGPLEYSESYGIQPNNLLVKTKPYSFTWDERNGDSVVALAANGSQRRNMSNDDSGFLDLRRLKGVATSQDYTLYMFDGEHQRYLSNRQIHSRLIVGNGLRPFELPIPLLLHRTQALTLNLTDLSGAPNDVRLIFEGHRYYFDANQLYDRFSPATKVCQPFFYTTDSDVSIAVGLGTTEVTAYITMASEGDFYLKRILSYSDGIYRVRISDVSTGLEFSNGWIHSTAFGGNSEYYADFNPAMLLQRKTQLKLRFVNLSGGNNNIYIALAGYNAYYQRS